MKQADNINKKPEIVVVMSTYNGDEYISEQLDSILSQEFVDVKILIRDDGSSDGTSHLLYAYSQKYPDNIQVIIGENVGFAQSFTEALKKAYTGYNDIQYYAFADQDDVWLADKLIAGINLIRTEDVSLPVTYCSNTTQVDTYLKFINYAWRDKEVNITKECSLVQSFATGCTMVFNRKAVELYVLYHPDEINVHDYLMYQICMFLGKVVYDSTSHILYRQHTTNQFGRPGFKGRMRKRLQGHYKEHTLEFQNKRFLNAYQSLLTDEDKHLIKKITTYKDSFYKRLSLLFNYKIRYNSLEKDFFYRLKIVLGGV